MLMDPRILRSGIPQILRQRRGGGGVRVRLQEYFACVGFRLSGSDTIIVRQSISVCSYCNAYEYLLGEHAGDSRSASNAPEQKSLQGYARYTTSKIVGAVVTCDLATSSSSNWLVSDLAACCSA